MVENTIHTIPPNCAVHSARSARKLLLRKVPLKDLQITLIPPLLLNLKPPLPMLLRWNVLRLDIASREPVAEFASGCHAMLRTKIRFCIIPKNVDRKKGTGWRYTPHKPPESPPHA